MAGFSFLVWSWTATFCFAFLGGFEDLWIDYAKLGHLFPDPFFLWVHPWDSSARVWVFNHAHPIPNALP